MPRTGRPSGFKNINHEQIKFLILKRFTDKEISTFLGINELTLNRWKLKYPDFSKSLKDWKDEADSRIEHSLAERATGYRTKVKKPIVVSDGSIRGSHIEWVEVEEVWPPDPTSMIFWLKNRHPDRWRDKKESEITAKLNVSETKIFKVKKINH